jgi:hypothetical protein
LAALGVGLLAPLLLAAVLEPDPRGHGTHEQLGLLPCTFVVLFGCRCPACGMTTSWANLVRMRLGDAVRANVGGTLLAVVSLVAVPWLLLSALRGRWLGRAPTSTTLAIMAALVAAITLIDWAVRLLVGLS